MSCNGDFSLGPVDLLITFCFCCVEDVFKYIIALACLTNRTVISAPNAIRCFLGMSKSEQLSASLSVLVGSTAASVLAGGIGSAVGTGIAFPIDVLKTKMQVNVCTKGTSDETVFMRARKTFRDEGIAGFFGGVTTAMIGNALISAVAFSANELAIGVLNTFNFMGGRVGGGADTAFVTLLLAACFSGIIQTFAVVPVGKFKSFELNLMESSPKK